MVVSSRNRDKGKGNTPERTSDDLSSSLSAYSAPFAKGKKLTATVGGSFKNLCAYVGLICPSTAAAPPPIRRAEVLNVRLPIRRAMNDMLIVYDRNRDTKKEAR